jgi:manganese transport protein
MDSLFLAAAMLGATVMPHVVYLHSALTRDRFGAVPAGPVRKQVLKATKTDVALAMLLAGAVNISMLLLAASALPGRDDVDTIEAAHHAVSTGLGPVVGVLFAVGLLASGLASTSVGCYAGSVIMEGLLRWRVPLLTRRVVTLIPLLTRRVVTLIPALPVLAVGADPTTVLVISQVVLSFGLPFVLIPLLSLTSNRTLMGSDANRGPIKIGGWVITAAMIALITVLIVSVFTRRAPTDTPSQ